jgi:hypothetical protein
MTAVELAIANARSLCAVRGEHSDRVAEAFKAVGASLKSVEAAQKAANAALATYDGAPSPESEAQRLAARQASSDALAPYAGVDAALEHLQLVIADARRSSESVALASRTLLDPEKVRLASAGFALAPCRRTLRSGGHKVIATSRRSRRFSIQVAISNAAAADLAVDAGGYAPVFFFASYLEALADAGRVAVYLSTRRTHTRSPRSPQCGAFVSPRRAARSTRRWRRTFGRSSLASGLPPPAGAARGTRSGP